MTDTPTAAFSPYRAPAFPARAAFGRTAPLGAVLVVAVLAALAPAGTHAQDDPLPSAESLVTALTPPRGAAMASQLQQRHSLSSVTIAGIAFAPGSARLTTEARTVLDVVGTALTAEPLAGFRFLIVGHTDASGGMIDNQRLSEERADAARRYLIEAFGIAPARLESVGLGELDLLHPDEPGHAANRRIEITNIGPH